MSAQRRYRLRSTGYGSQRYGACEICGEPASEVYVRIDERAFTHPDGSQHWAHCRALFGHQECLQNEEGGVHHE